MRHNLFVGAACGLALACAGTAVNAAPADLWTGFYVGAATGYGWQSTKVPSVSGLNPEGIIGDVQAGYDQRVGPVVLGARLDIFPAHGLPGRATTDCPAGYCAPVPVTIGTHAETQWLAGIGGRIGLPFGSWLPYITGGYHRESERVNVTETTILGSTSTSESASGSGSYLGGGFQYNLTRHWSLTAEYIETISHFGKLDASARTKVLLSGVRYRF